MSSLFLPNIGREYSVCVDNAAGSILIITTTTTKKIFKDF